MVRITLISFVMLFLIGCSSKINNWPRGMTPFFAECQSDMKVYVDRAYLKRKGQPCEGGWRFYDRGDSSKGTPNYPRKYTRHEKQYDQSGKISSSNQAPSNDTGTSIIRLRGLSGNYTSDSQKVKSSTYTIIWDRLGIGQSTLKYKTSISGDKYDLENKLINISYTFGDDFTLTIGGGSVTNGELTITSSDSEIFNSSNVDGLGYFGILGFDIGFFEILAGIQYTRYTFTEFDTESTSTNWANFDGSGELFITGIGFSF